MVTRKALAGLVAAFVVGGGVFDDTLHTGWLIQGGGRSLFFNPEGDAAWTVDLSLSNFYNHGKRPDIRIPLRGILVPSAQQIQGQTQTVRVPLVNVTVSDLDRTFANLGFGREWYLLGNAYSNTNTWRVGFDTGGRWGSASLETHELRHRTDVMGAVWVAAHTDVEIPCGCCIFQYGLRLEWDYTWSDILQLQNKADIQDLNLLVNLGVRF